MAIYGYFFRDDYLVSTSSLVSASWVAPFTENSSRFTSAPVAGGIACFCMSQKVANRLPIISAVLAMPEGLFSQLRKPPLPGPTLFRAFVEFNAWVKGQAKRFSIMCILLKSIVSSVPQQTSDDERSQKSFSGC
jgi:hypothetical protein